MMNISVAPGAVNPLHAFYTNLANSTELDWPKDAGHPYTFIWADDVYRDQIIGWLCATDSRKSDLAARLLLQWLMFRFRVANFRRGASRLPDFAGRRWIWATAEEVSRATVLTENQIRRAVDGLMERRLIERRYDYALGNVPHYRPSADLFRVCICLTVLTDGDALAAHAPGADDEGALFKKVHQNITTNRLEELRGLVEGFARNPEADRFTTLQDGYRSLMQQAMDEAQDAQ